MDSSFARVFKIIATLAVIFVIGWLVILLKSIIILLVISAVLAYILDPFASYLEFRGFSRLQSTILIFLSFAIVCGILLYLLVPTLIHEISYMQHGLGGTQTSDLIEKIEKTIQDNIPIFEGQNLQLYEKLQSVLKDISDSFFSILLRNLQRIEQTLLVRRQIPGHGAPGDGCLPSLDGLVPLRRAGA